MVYIPERWGQLHSSIPVPVCLRFLTHLQSSCTTSSYHLSALPRRPQLAHYGCWFGLYVLSKTLASLSLSFPTDGLNRGSGSPLLETRHQYLLQGDQVRPLSMTTHASIDDPPDPAELSIFPAAARYSSSAVLMRTSSSTHFCSSRRCARRLIGGFLS